MNEDADRQFLRHTLATLAYRAEKPLRQAPPGFENSRACPGCRAAGEILAHLADLLNWALLLAQGRHEWHDAPPLPWDQQVQRFFGGLGRLDDFLKSDEPLRCPAQKLFQGPIADALTHVGQLATLRRIAGSPVRGENYFKAEITIGRVGPEQSAQRVEFD